MPAADTINDSVSRSTQSTMSDCLRLSLSLTHTDNLTVEDGGGGERERIRGLVSKEALAITK